MKHTTTYFLKGDTEMTEFEKVLMNRDDLSAEEANIELQNASESIYDILGDEGSYDEIEDMLAMEYGLEMDYIWDLLI